MTFQAGKSGNPKALDHATVRDLRIRMAREPVRDVAVSTGISKSTLYAIRCGESYPDAGGPVVPRRSREWARFTDRQIRAIRVDAQTMSRRQVAEKYGASPMYVSHLARGKYRRAAGGPIEGEDKSSG